MTEQDREARDRILVATIDLMDEVMDIDRITVRQIAERAGVGVGLINYHFQSKDNLIQTAVMATLEAMEDRWQPSLEGLEGDPVSKLKTVLKANSQVGVDNPKYALIGLKHILLEGEMDVPLVILPLLRQQLGERYGEIELRMLALALVVTMQVAFLRSKTFFRYSGVDLFDQQQRNQLIDQFVDLLVPEENSK